jgi:2-polyprenyl-3-methyl-5-hydroxy-6-metoxy-1,4-benzoquinol methylase
MTRQDHWEAVYRSKAPEEVSWFQADPGLSLALIEATGSGRDARILDVGGGASVLTDRLIEEGFEHLGVLDVSAAALSAARQRLGPSSHAVEWIQCDVVEYRARDAWHVWHDRAVFHFLIDPLDRARYREALYRAVPTGGHVIVATFAPDGPDRCSGLPTLRCSAEDIASELGAGTELIDATTETHRTPSGVRQEFVYARLVRVDTRPPAIHP